MFATYCSSLFIAMFIGAIIFDEGMRTIILGVIIFIAVVAGILLLILVCAVYAYNNPATAKQIFMWLMTPLMIWGTAVYCIDVYNNFKNKE